MSKRVNYSYQVETITPTKARQYLSNVHPRQSGRDMRSMISSYAREMTAGTWDTSVAQTISFDTTGALVDGWHRLHAIEESGMSLPFLVVRNVDPDSFSNYDAGRSRSMAFRRGINKDRQAIISGIIRTALYPYGSNRHTVEQSNLTEEFAKEYLDYYFEHATKTNRTRLTTASIRTGVVLCLMAHPDRKASIVYAYNDMVHADFGKAPRSMANLYRRCLDEVGLQNVMQVALAWHAFNPYKFNNGKLLVRDMGKDYKEIQDRVLSDLIGAIK